MSTQILGVEIGVADTVAKFPLGSEYRTPDGDEYVYMQADGAVTSGLLYAYDRNTWQVEDPADATNFPADTKSIFVGVSPVTLADNEYTWVFVGPGEITCLTDATGVAAADAICYISATAGTVSSGATAALLKGVSADAIIAGGASGTIRAANRMWSEDLP